jgi:hypothetical protein
LFDGSDQDIFLIIDTSSYMSFISLGLIAVWRNECFLSHAHRRMQNRPVLGRNRTFGLSDGDAAAVSTRGFNDVLESDCTDVQSWRRVNNI